MIAYLQTFGAIFLEISPFVILGMLAAGIVHEALGRFQTLRSFAVKRSFWSLSFFNFSGFTLPICSCGVIPLAVGLRRQGVPYGNVFTFIFSAPATSVAALILSLAVLGPDFTLFYVAGALVCGYAVGAAFYLVERRQGPRTIHQEIRLDEEEASDTSSHGFAVRALQWGTVVYGSRIAFDLIVGLALAALLVSTYSVQALGSWVDGLPYGIAGPLMIAIAIPLYVCSLPGIVVAASLVLGGFPPAMIWVFLMAGPVTNLGDINVMRRNLGWRHTALYVGVVVLATLLWGWLIQVNLQWESMWAHVLEYYASQPSLAGSDANIGNAVAESNWVGLPREVYYGSALLMALLTVNGAWQTLRSQRSVRAFLVSVAARAWVGDKQTGNGR